MRKHAFALRSRARSRRLRIVCIMAAFAAIFAGAFIRLVQLGMEEEAGRETRLTYDRAPGGRPAIVDRNGQSARDRHSDRVTLHRAAVDSRSGRGGRETHCDLPGTRRARTPCAPPEAKMPSRGSSGRYRRTSSRRSSMRDVAAVGFRPENQRLYPNGSLAAHVLGAVDIDNFRHCRHRKMDRRKLARRPARQPASNLRGVSSSRSSFQSTCAFSSPWSRNSAKPSRNSELPRVPGSCSTSRMAKYWRSPPIRPLTRTIPWMPSSPTG
jgi:hypothetical protein